MRINESMNLLRVETILGVSDFVLFFWDFMGGFSFCFLELDFHAMSQFERTAENIKEKHANTCE